MDNEFLDTHKEAEKLVKNLKKLNDEIKGYKSSKIELNKLNETLSGFIQETSILSEKTSKIIENTSKLTPFKNGTKINEIYDRLCKLELDFKLFEERIEETENSINGQMSLISNKVEKMLDKYNHNLNEQIEKTENSIIDELMKISEAISRNNEEIKNKKISIFGFKK